MYPPPSPFWDKRLSSLTFLLVHSTLLKSLSNNDRGNGSEQRRCERCLHLKMSTWLQVELTLFLLNDQYVKYYNNMLIIMWQLPLTPSCFHSFKWFAGYCGQMRWSYNNIWCDVTFWLQWWNIPPRRPRAMQLDIMRTLKDNCQQRPTPWQFEHGKHLGILHEILSVP